jgi:predicted peptidase
MGKIINILTVIFLANSMACSNSQNTKLNAESNSVVVISYKNIEFKSQEVTLRGRLYLPDDKSEKRPVVIMAHGFTTTIKILVLVMVSHVKKLIFGCNQGVISMVSVLCIRNQRLIQLE